MAATSGPKQSLSEMENHPMTHPTTEQRELLELAARAVGFGDGPHDFDKRTGWNPLEKDDDALWLAVKLGMQIDMRDPETRIYALGAGDVITEYHTNRDALAATRRAIVRAAAAIAKGEK
jgi:hypothetical protein